MVIRDTVLRFFWESIVGMHGAAFGEGEEERRL
jgi:hypothetical protein